MGDPWFRIIVSNPSNKPSQTSSEGLFSTGRIESHPLVVSIPQNTLNRFIEFDENVEVYIILSLWASKDGSKNYRPGSRELLVHALSDTGIGVEPLVDPRIASLPLPDDEKADSNVIVVTPFFAALHGLRHGDLFHVRRIKDTNVILDSVALLPISPLNEYDHKDLVDALLSKAHVVSQGGLILSSYPKTRSNGFNTTSNQPNGTNATKNTAGRAQLTRGPKPETPSTESTELLSKNFLGFIVLDTLPICQGVLTRKTTIYIIPSSGAPSTASNDSTSSNLSYESRLHELYHTSFSNGAVTIAAAVSSLGSNLSASTASSSLSASFSASNLLSSSTATPPKPLMRSSMLVVPLGGSPYSSPDFAASGLGPSIKSPPSLLPNPVSTPTQGYGRTQPRSPGTRGATPASSPASVNSSTIQQRVDVLNRPYLRVAMIKEPLVKLTSKARTTQDKISSGSSSLQTRVSSSSTQSSKFDGDITLEVGVSLETMKQQTMGIFNGSWVEISVSSNQSPQAYQDIKRQLARIFVVESGLDYTLYMPPNMIFNLGLEAHCSTNLVKISPASYVDQYLKERSDTKSTGNSSTTQNLMGEAKTLHFAIISHPSNPHYSASLASVTRFFQRPRIMRENELFAVVVKKQKFLELFDTPVVDTEDSDEDEILELDANTSGEDATIELDTRNGRLYQVVHFKVTSIAFAGDQSAYFAYVPSAPTAFTDGEVHSRVPADLDHFLISALRGPIASHQRSLAPVANSPALNINTIAPKRLVESPSGSLSDKSLSGLSAQFEELSAILRPCLHPLSASYGLFVSALVHGGRGAGKTRLARSLASRLGISIVEVNCFELIGHTDVETEKKLAECFERATKCAPALLLLREFQAFDDTKPEASMEPSIANALKDKITSLPAIHQRVGFPVMLMAMTTNIETISRNLRALFRVEVAIPSPDEQSRLAMILDILEEHGATSSLHRGVSLRSLSLKTASFQRKHLSSLITKAAEYAMERVLDFQNERMKKSKRKQEGSIIKRGIQYLERDLTCAGILITSDDFDQALHVLQSSNSSALGTPKIPQVKWEDVGGLLEAKREILDTIQLPLQHPELFTKGGMSQRSGILLYGPPGTGKTLLAKAVATECSLNFISVKGPELINMYIGESEKNVREVFQRARDARPCVIFFDELDSLAPNRGRTGDSGGVMDRIVSQLLAELSGMSQKTDVFVIGATNRPDLIDPALLVPGRFDKLIFLGVNAEITQKHNVLTAVTRKFNLGSSVDLMKLAELCPQNLTGADLYALCSDAMSIAIKTQIASLHSLSQEKLDQLKKDEIDMPVVVEQEHFVTALNQLTPSVSMDELERYKEMATKFQKKT